MDNYNWAGQASGKRAKNVTGRKPLAGAHISWRRKARWGAALVLLTALSASFLIPFVKDASDRSCSAGILPAPGRLGRQDACPTGDNLFELLERQVKHEEYAIRSVAGVLEADNPINRLGVAFKRDGVEVSDTSRSAGVRIMRLSLASLGRAGDMRVVEAVEPIEHGQCVEYRKEHVTEWYRNSVKGLEQGFDISARPPGQGELRLLLKVAHGRASAAGAGAVRIAAGTRSLRFSGLAIKDATGATVPAQLELRDHHTIALVVQDSAASYPLYIDPTLGDANWVAGFHTPGASGAVSAIVRQGSNIYVGGNFTTVANASCSNVAKWDGTTWSALGSGVSASVTALAVDGSGNLYAGGSFTSAGGVSANYIARWDGTNWYALGSGTSTTVNALAVDASGNLYAGGPFTSAGGAAANYIARWNGSSWSAVGSGMNNTVYALAADGSGNLYAGGVFTLAGGVAANRIARWDGTSWYALGSGMNSGVAVLALGGSGNLYAAGVFTTAGGVGASYIARWDGSNWFALGSGINNNTVYALSLDSSANLYAGGTFTAAGGVSANYIARWDGANWSALGSATSGAVKALCFDGSGNLFAGGGFATAGAVVTNNIARWDGANWSAPGGGAGMNNTVNALVSDGTGNLYAGGNFMYAGVTPNCNSIARWNGTSWSQLGSGLGGTVYALALDKSLNLYAGGTGFAPPAGSNVARWNGTSWSAVGTTFGGLAVYALAFDGSGNNLYAAGQFSSAGGVSAKNIARWNGTNWSALGSGTSNTVKALAVDTSGNLYAGGPFTSAGGVSANYIARWDGVGWAPLGNGTAGNVNALAFDTSGNLYAGGTFSSAGGVSANNIARWDGVGWSPLGNGTDSTVNALALDGSGSLYAGGGFSSAGGVPAVGIACWGGSAWSALGSGVSAAGTVSALQISGSGPLYAGGSFTLAGDKVSSNIAAWSLAPVITSPLTANATVGQSFSYQITASGNPTSYNATGLPAWASVNTSTGAITGMPPATGSTNVTISATNAIGTGSATLTITTSLPSVALPTFSPAAGTYPSAQSVTISTTTAGATIYYTLDGNTPTPSSTKYTGAINVAASTTIKAYATNAGMNDSAVASATYTINNGTVATPTFSPATGTFTSAQSVTMATTTAGATIYYTTDGSTPTPTSTKYTAAINVAATTTIKAYAVNAGMSDSAVASATYTISAVVATPTFSPAAGTYTSAQSVTVSTTTAGATIYYTTDGSTPTASSTKYSGAINVAATTTIKAYAVSAGLTDSAVASATYTINLPPVITSATTVGGTVGVAFSYQILGSNNPTSYGATGLPTWASMNTNTGAITGTPDAAAKTSVTISATNAGGTGSATLTITITTQAPAITSTLTATGTVGQQFSYTITATGATPMTFSAQPLPNGLSLSGTTISGTPTAAGQTNIAIGAANSLGSDSKTLQLTINPQGAPTITSPLTASGQVGTAFSYQIQANGDTPMQFFVDASKLPAGLSFSGDTISGTPTAVGNASLPIQAQNTLGTDTETLTITINVVGAPAITSLLTASSKAGAAFSYTITATGNGTITFGASPLPAWLTLSGVALSGSPLGSDVGIYNVTLTASNSLGTDTKVLQISITPIISDPPVVTDIYRSRNPVRTNVAVSFTAVAVSPSGYPLTYSWFFFNSQSVQDGPALGGQSVTRSFPLQDNYTVVAIAFDGFTKSTQFQKISVTLDPNSGSAAKSLLTGMQATNPVTSLGLSVPDSLGGVLDLDVVDTSATGKDRAGETFETRCPAITYDYGGANLAGKFSAASIFVVETTGTQASGATRKARLMAPISGWETGQPPVATDGRSKTGLTSFTLKGKFTFGSKPDSVTLSCTVELPAGLTVNASLPVSVGIGNVTGSATVDPKGKVMGLTSAGSGATPITKPITKLQFKWPRLDKKNPVTKTGDQATLAITLAGKSLDAAGFDTEGIVKSDATGKTLVTGKKGVDRNIQTAIVIGGVSYYAQAKAAYVLTKGTGQLTGRAQK